MTKQISLVQFKRLILITYQYIQLLKSSLILYTTGTKLYNSLNLLYSKVKNILESLQIYLNLCLVK